MQVPLQVYKLTQRSPRAPEQSLRIFDTAPEGDWRGRDCSGNWYSSPTLHRCTHGCALKRAEELMFSQLSCVGADDVKSALYLSKICCYAQGMHLIAVASREQNWNLNLAEISRIWKGTLPTWKTEAS